MIGTRMDRFEHLYKTYYRSVFSFFIRFGFSREEAKDLAQDVFLRVYEFGDDFHAEWKFLEVIARRVAFNRIRDNHAKKREAHHVPIEDLIEEPESPATTQEDVMVKREQKALQRRRLREAIEQLQPSLRECVLLRLDGLSYNEIAAALHITVDAVKARLHQVKLRLKELLPSDSGDLSWLADPSVEDEP
jgi:RNA polymerase sigma-70 factor (ECF subfamily)